MTDFVSFDLVEYISNCTLFKDLSREEVLELTPYLKFKKISEGQILFHQGDDAKYIYILVKGKLLSSLTKPSGHIIDIGKIHPGETIGEMGSFTGEPRSLTMEAIADSEVLFLPNTVFRDICHKHPKIAEEVSRIFFQRALKVIKLMSHEKKKINISIVLKAVEDPIADNVQEKLASHLGLYNIYFLADENLRLDQLHKMIIKAETSEQHLIIYLAKWNEEIFRLIKDKLTHFYLVVKDGERPLADNTIKKVIFDAHHIPHIRIELIILHADSTKRVVNTRKWLEQADFILHHHVHLNSDSDYQRLARFMTGNAFALVLGGGGARGLLYLGVMKALFERQIPIDAIGGTSIGAGVGICYAQTLNYAQTCRFVNQLKEASIKSVMFPNISWPIISLYTSNPGTRELKKIVGNLCLEDLWIPYFCVSANLSTRKENIHRMGLIWEAVRSSSALPGIFPPVVFNGQLLFDGGLLNNLPVDTMRNIIGPGHIIIAATLSKRDKSPDVYHFPPVLTFKEGLLSRLGLAYRDNKYPPFLLTFIESLLLGSSYNEEQSCRLADILIKPSLARFRMIKLNKKEEDHLIQVGYKETIRVIDKYLEAHPHFKK